MRSARKKKGISKRSSRLGNSAAVAAIVAASTDLTVGNGHSKTDADQAVDVGNGCNTNTASTSKSLAATNKSNKKNRNNNSNAGSKGKTLPVESPKSTAVSSAKSSQQKQTSFFSTERTAAVEQSVEERINAGSPDYLKDIAKVMPFLLSRLTVDDPVREAVKVAPISSEQSANMMQQQQKEQKDRRQRRTKPAVDDDVLTSKESEDSLFCSEVLPPSPPSSPPPTILTPRPPVTISRFSSFSMMAPASSASSSFSSSSFPASAPAAPPAPAAATATNKPKLSSLQSVPAPLLRHWKESLAKAEAYFRVTQEMLKRGKSENAVKQSALMEAYSSSLAALDKVAIDNRCCCFDDANRGDGCCGDGNSQIKNITAPTEKKSKSRKSRLKSAAKTEKTTLSSSSASTSAATTTTSTALTTASTTPWDFSTATDEEREWAKAFLQSDSTLWSASDLFQNEFTEPKASQFTDSTLDEMLAAYELETAAMAQKKLSASEPQMLKNGNNSNSKNGSTTTETVDPVSKTDLYFDKPLSSWSNNSKYQSRPISEFEVDEDDEYDFLKDETSFIDEPKSSSSPLSLPTKSSSTESTSPLVSDLITASSESSNLDNELAKGLPCSETSQPAKTATSTAPGSLSSSNPVSKLAVVNSSSVQSTLSNTSTGIEKYISKRKGSTDKNGKCAKVETETATNSAQKEKTISALATTSSSSSSVLTTTMPTIKMKKYAYCSRTHAGNCNQKSRKVGGGTCGGGKGGGAEYSPDLLESLEPLVVNGRATNRQLARLLENVVGPGGGKSGQARSTEEQQQSQCAGESAAAGSSGSRRPSPPEVVLPLEPAVPWPATEERGKALGLVLRWLDYRSLFTARRVCRPWRAAIEAYLRTRSSVKLFDWAQTYPPSTSTSANDDKPSSTSASASSSASNGNPSSSTSSSSSSPHIGKPSSTFHSPTFCDELLLSASARSKLSGAQPEPARLGATLVRLLPAIISVHAKCAEKWQSTVLLTVLGSGSGGGGGENGSSWGPALERLTIYGFPKNKALEGKLVTLIFRHLPSLRSLSIYGLEENVISPLQLPTRLPALAQLDTFYMEGYAGDLTPVLSQLGPPLTNLLIASEYDRVNLRVRPWADWLASNPEVGRRLRYLDISVIPDDKRRLWNLLCRTFTGVEKFRASFLFGLSFEDTLPALRRLPRLHQLYFNVDLKKGPYPKLADSKLAPFTNVRTLFLGAVANPNFDIATFRATIGRFFPNIEELRLATFSPAAVELLKAVSKRIFPQLKSQQIGLANRGTMEVGVQQQDYNE